MTTNLKWLIAHEPQHLFKRAADAFAEKISARTNNEVQIDVLTEAEYKNQIDDSFSGKKSQHLFSAIEENKIQLGHTNVHYFGSIDKNFHVFDMPFLFEDHEHASRVFDGEIGMTMASRLANGSKMRGLCFTYSGGYRIIGSNEEFTSVEDLKGKRVRVNGNPVNADFMTAVGAIPKAQESYGYDEIISGNLEASETTYIRFLGKHVLKTEHNMFLTMIVINTQTWNSMTAETQLAFQEVAAEVAKLERQWSIEDAAKFERDSIANGVTINSISPEDKALLRKSSDQVYQNWNQYFAPGLLDAINAEKLH